MDPHPWSLSQGEREELGPLVAKRGTRGVSMKVYYSPHLRTIAQNLRRNSTRSEIILWKHLKGKKVLGFDFNRQKPVGKYIVDFYCSRLKLAIEVDGYTHRFDDIARKDG
jgi:very-short-patch-repair endonuclease